MWANRSSAVGGFDDVAYNYLPAMSTYLQSLVNGFGGVRLRRHRLDLNPTLPSGVTSLNLVGLDYLGAQLNVMVRSDLMTPLSFSTTKWDIMRADNQ